MRSLKLLILGIFIVAGCAKKAPLPDHVQFFKGDFTSALQKAASEDKMLMVNFYTDW